MLQKRSEPDPRCAGKQVRIYPHPPQSETHNGSAAPVISENPETADRHRDVRSPRRSGYAHIEREDEERIENEIETEADYHAHHRPDSSSLGPDGRRKAESDMGEHVRKKDDFQICPRRLPRAFAYVRRAAPFQDGVEIEVNYRRKQEKENKFQRNELAEQLFAADPVAFAEFYGKNRRVTYADKNPERREEHDYGHRERERGRRVDAAAVTYKGAVDDRIEGIQRHRDQRGPRIPQKELDGIFVRKLLQFFGYRARRSHQKTTAVSGNAARMRSISSFESGRSPSWSVLRDFQAEMSSGRRVSDVDEKDRCSSPGLSASH